MHCQCANPIQKIIMECAYWIKCKRCSYTLCSICVESTHVKNKNNAAIQERYKKACNYHEKNKDAPIDWEHL